MSNAVSVAILNQDEILERISNGEPLPKIATSLQVSKQALSYQLKDNPNYKDAIVFGIEAKMDEYVEAMEGAQSSIDIARTRELLTHSRFLAERLARDKYGKDTVQVSAQAPVFNVILNTAPVSGVEIEVKSE